MFISFLFESSVVGAGAGAVCAVVIDKTVESIFEKPLSYRSYFRCINRESHTQRDTANVSEVNGQMSSSVEIKIMHTFMILCYLVYKSHALSVRVRRRFLSTSVFFK